MFYIYILRFSGHFCFGTLYARNGAVLEKIEKIEKTEL